MRLPESILRTLSADSTGFVQVPLDVMLANYYRARRTALMIPQSRRLGWLQQRDVEERAEWVARFRESTRTLEEVVKQVFGARDAHWIVSPTEWSFPAPSAPAAPSKDSGSQLMVGKPVNGRQVARVMRNGTKLCAAFQ